jgi:hypothetical protein
MEVELVAIVLTPLNRPGSGERPGHNRHVVFGKYDMKRETSALSVRPETLRVIRVGYHLL